MNVLDLFSGIGGFSLGLERAGMRTIAFCEVERYCRAVLAKRWPGVPIYGDIRELHLSRGFADVICGGFPCQDISTAGDGAGLSGSRSGLWSEYERLIEEVRPRWAVIENVSALRSRGLEQILRELASIGYDAEWYCVPACAVGALHRRDRIWIIAYPNGDTLRVDQQRRSARRSGQLPEPGQAVVGDHGHAQPVADSPRDVRAEQAPRGTEWQRTGEGSESILVSDSHLEGQHERGKPDLRSIQAGLEASFRDDARRLRSIVADPDEPRLERWLRRELQECARKLAAGASGSPVADTDSDAWIERRFGVGTEGEERGNVDRSGIARSFPEIWFVEPDVGRVADGVPSRVDRLRALGNAVVPQIPEIIGRAILEWQAGKR